MWTPQIHIRLLARIIDAVHGRNLWCRPVTVSTPVFATPPCLAVIVTFVEFDTLCVVIVNVALVEPAVTVTLAETVATDVLLLERVTEVFAEGALLNVTVP
jgi:hypothetical protein